jgi:hypothetical protein
MKKLLQWLLRKPIAWLAEKVSSSPVKNDVFSSLSKLQEDIIAGKGNNGIILPFQLDTGKFIILSDQHKGGRDFADDFKPAEANYLTALKYYYNNEFTLIGLGDCEELWENTPKVVIEKNREALLEEARFLQQDRYYRIFGNHDLEWNYVI